MATDLFGTETAIGGAWKLDGAVLTIEGGQDLVAQSVTINYTRQMTPIFPINQDKRYLIAGLPMGTVQMASVIGPSTGIKAFLDRYSDICQIGKNVLTIKPAGTKSCTGNNVVEFICAGCIINGINMTVDKTAGANVVLLTVTMDFLSLTVK